jgi:DNA-binding SARP family transcriptional activator
MRPFVRSHRQFGPYAAADGSVSLRCSLVPQPSATPFDVTSSSTLSLRLLGAVEIATASGASTVAARPKLLALVGYLCAYADQGPRSRSELMALLWPESSPSDARNSMRQALHVLRVSLGAGVFVSSADAVGLAADLVSCDVIDLDRALRDRDDLKTVQAYRGQFLAGLAVPNAPQLMQWIEHARTSRRRQVMFAARRLAVAAEIDGNAAMMLRWARRAAELQQPWERADEELMALVARAEAGAAESSRTDESRAPIPTPIRAQLAVTGRVVVTPLLVLSTKDDCGAVAAGFTAALAREITQRSVHPHTATSSTAKGASHNGHSPPEAAAAVVGTLEPLDVHYRVSLQLVSPSQSILWSDLFTLRVDEIEATASRAVDMMFDGTTTAPDHAVPVTPDSVTDDAGIAVLRGDHFLWRQTPEDLKRALHWYETATRLDPRRARGWAGLGQVLSMMAVFGAAEATDTMPTALDALDRAIALDGQSATALALRALVCCVWEWNFARGASLSSAAHALNPSEHRSWIVDALYHHAPLGRADDALRAAAELSRVAPVDASALSYASLAAGFFDPVLARRYAEESLHLEPNLPGGRWALSAAAAGAGDFDVAMLHADHLVRTSGGDAGFRGYRALLAARSGDVRAADAALQQLLAEPALSSNARYYIALLKNALGDVDGAVFGLAAEVERRNPLVIYLGVDQSLGALRTHPMVLRLRQRIGV